MVTTTGTRGVVRGPITSAGVNMGSGLVIMHEFLEFLRKGETKGAVQLTPNWPSAGLGDPGRAHQEPPRPFPLGTHTLGTL